MYSKELEEVLETTFDLWSTQAKEFAKKIAEEFNNAKTPKERACWSKALDMYIETIQEVQEDWKKL